MCVWCAFYDLKTILFLGMFIVAVCVCMCLCCLVCFLVGCKHVLLCFCLSNAECICWLALFLMFVVFLCMLSVLWSLVACVYVWCFSCVVFFVCWF